MADIQGTWDPRFEGVATALSASLDAGTDVGASVAVLVGGEPVVDIWGGTRRRGRDGALGGGHHHQRLVDHQDHDLPVRPDAGRPGRPRLLRAGGPLLARVRRRRQGGASRSATCMAHTAGLPGWDEPLAPEDLADWERCTAAAGRPGTVVGAGHGVGLPRRDPGLPDRRGGAADHRRCPSGRGSPPRWPGRSAPTSSSACPESEDHRVSVVIPPPPLDLDGAQPYRAGRPGR